MEFVEKIVGMSIGLVVISVMGVMGINAIVNSSMPNADPAVVMMFQVLIPIIYVVAIILYMLRH